MGCGCGQKRLPRATTTRPLVEPKTYRNGTDERLVARNPRTSLEPGDTIEIVPGRVSYTLRNWIRTGALVEN